MRRTGRVGSVGAVIAALWLAGCGEPGAPEADGGPADDGGEPTGMTVDFAYLGASGEPAPLDRTIELDGYSIHAITIQIHRVRLTGDSTLGDELVAPSGVLELPASQSPRVAFPSAPPGLYSRLDWRVERTDVDEERPPGFEGERLSIRVLGEATVEQGTLPFEYVDEKKVDVELGFAAEIGPDDPGEVSIRLDVAAWFSVVDWQDLADGPGNSGPGGGDDGGDDAGPDGDDGGPGGPGGGDDEDEVLRIGRGGGDPRVADDLRERLATSFRVVGSAAR